MRKDCKAKRNGMIFALLGGMFLVFVLWGYIGSFVFADEMQAQTYTDLGKEGSEISLRWMKMDI